MRMDEPTLVLVPWSFDWVELYSLLSLWTVWLDFLKTIITFFYWLELGCFQKMEFLQYTFYTQSHRLLTCEQFFCISDIHILYRVACLESYNALQRSTGLFFPPGRKLGSRHGYFRLVYFYFFCRRYSINWLSRIISDGHILHICPAYGIEANTMYYLLVRSNGIFDTNLKETLVVQSFFFNGHFLSSRGIKGYIYIYIWPTTKNYPTIQWPKMDYFTFWLCISDIHVLYRVACLESYNALQRSTGLFSSQP